ncbi:type II toxin-antitoxin system YafQ family toxin [Levilactobacillus brevis]|nr:type II toxin-antitoxin system YafQ family toxin [Levilactobacillus brevis]
MIKTVRTTKIFERNLKKLKKKHYDTSRLTQAVSLITHGDQEALIRKYKWHMLKGDKAGINEIHLDSNWLLLYKIIDDDVVTLLLLATGPHDLL